MLRSIKNLHEYMIQATDGKIGHVHEFYFDDDRWTIRYLIVDTGTWLPGRHVLISPTAIQEVDWVIPKLAVDLTKGQIQESPEVDVYKPFSSPTRAELRQVLRLADLLERRDSDNTSRAGRATRYRRPERLP